jgi:thiol-disulfide isomerase/thioredoxin
MKKNLLCIVVTILLFGCNNTIESPQNKMAIGIINSQQLLAEYLPFSRQFHHFTLTSEQVAQVQAWPNDIVIDVYFGSWCHDSQREVPILLKALTVNPALKTHLIGVDWSKQDPQGLAKKANINFTATFIVLKNGQEIGRVIERPKINLISDLNNIIMKT